MKNSRMNKGTVSRRRKNNRKEMFIRNVILFLATVALMVSSVFIGCFKVQAEEDDVIVIHFKIEQPEKREVVKSEEVIEIETDEATAETFESKPDILDTLSKEELYYFAECVQIEAESESFEGKKAVASVLMNRVKSYKFPGGYKSVVTEKKGDTYQFSSYSSSVWGKKEISDEVYDAIREVLENGSNVGDSTYFANLNIVTGGWFYTAQKSGELVKVAEIGGHTFFRTN